jgi:hypothetical protein
VGLMIALYATLVASVALLLISLEQKRDNDELRRDLIQAEWCASLAESRPVRAITPVSPYRNDLAAAHARIQILENERRTMERILIGRGIPVIPNLLPEANDAEA